MEEAGKRMDDSERLVTSLLPLVERKIESYSLSTQCAIVSALSQMEHYSEVIFSSVASACCRCADATGGMAQASGSVRILDPTSASTSAPMDEDGRLGNHLMMMACSYGHLGHYDEDLFNLIAQQTGTR